MGGKSKCPFKRAYTTQKSNAKQRGVLFLLTFEQWKMIWVESGYWEQRGRGGDKYCMCRVGDAGAYDVGNVFIGLGTDNIRDGNLGRVLTENHRAKIASSNRGKPHEWSRGSKNPMHHPEVKAKISEATGGIKHYKQRGVITPQGYFVTSKEASQALGIPKPTIEWRARNNKFGFSQPTIA